MISASRALPGQKLENRDWRLNDRARMRASVSAECPLPHQAVGILHSEYSETHSDGTFGLCPPVLRSEMYLS